MGLSLYSCIECNLIQKEIRLLIFKNTIQKYSEDHTKGESYKDCQGILIIRIDMSSNIGAPPQEYEYYQQIKLLGEGSFGKAYLVQCKSDASLCVIKKMDIKHMSD